MPKPHSEHVSVFAPAVLWRCLLSASAATLVVSLIIAVIYRQDISHQRVLLNQEAQHVLDLQEELLEVEFRGVQSDLLYLAAQESLAQFLSGDVSVRSHLEREYASFAQSKSVYDQIRCLDTSGHEIIRINCRDGTVEVVPQSRLQNKAARYYHRQAQTLDRGEVSVSPFDLNMEHGQIEKPVKPVIRFLTPLFDESGKRRGMLVLNYLGAHLLSKLRQVSFGFPGRTMLVNSTGEYLQASDPSHEWGWLLGHQHSFRQSFPAAWDHVQREAGTELRLGEERFTFRWESPGLRAPQAPSSGVIGGDDQAGNSLILIAYVSSSAAIAHAEQLLNQLLLMSMAVMPVVALLSHYWARSGVIRTCHERRIAESESRLRQLSSQLLAAQETERRHLSRYLHDELSQQVTAISLDLQSLDRKDGTADSNPLLRRAIDETNQLLSSLHEIATRVRPSVLDDLGLQDAVESFLSEYQERTDIAIDARLQFDEAIIPATVGENIYRILQEALTNVAAHARVGEAEVSIESDGDLVRMTIHDAGAGFEVEEIRESARLGILGMRERVELLHGEFDLQSMPGVGTRITVSIPLNDDEE